MNIKKRKAIDAMIQGGKKLGVILKALMKDVIVGATPLDIEKKAQDLIKKQSGMPSFQTVRGYKWATCICVNDEVVHGIPGSTPFKQGDVVTVDVGMVYKGYHTDTATTKALFKTGENNEIVSFLHIGNQALDNAIANARPENRIGHISRAIEDTVASAGYSVIRSLVGHGIGKRLHESPQVPGVVTKPIETTPKLGSGMTLALEVIYTNGDENIFKDKDGWTVKTVDGGLSAVFEHTILITEKEPIVLTDIG